jgi:hypothetical protein
MKPLFFVGNVRSGTSLMVRLLNKHPNIYVSHESDICWILYQYYTHGKLKEKSFGRQKALKYTMKHYKKYIDTSKPVREVYEKIQTKLMKNGSLWLPSMKKRNLVYIGDKTPNNFVVNREYVEFVKEHFPDALYIHLVRHPKDFVASIKNRPRAWRVFGKTDSKRLKWWVRAEKQVKRLKKELNIMTITYHQLGKNTRRTMKTVFKELDLPFKGSIKNQFVKRHHYKMKLTPDAKELVKEYNLC